MVGRVLRFLCLSVFVLAGCAAPPPPAPPPTVVDLSLSATPDVNPDASGQGAPVMVRVYQLGSSASFSSAEFFQLFNQDQATLKTDLIKQDAYLLAPGQSKSVTLEPTDQVKSVGLFAAFRNYAQANWRASVDIPPHQTTKITVVCGRDGLTVKSEIVPPPKPAS